MGYDFFETCQSLFSSIKMWKRAAENYEWLPVEEGFRAPPNTPVACVEFSTERSVRQVDDGLRAPPNTPISGPESFDLDDFLHRVKDRLGAKDVCESGRTSLGLSSTGVSSVRHSIGSSRPDECIVESDGKFGLKLTICRSDVSKVVVKDATNTWYVSMINKGAEDMTIPMVPFAKNSALTEFVIEMTTPEGVLRSEALIGHPTRTTLLQSKYSELCRFLRQYPGFVSALNEAVDCPTTRAPAWREVIDAAERWLGW